MFWVNNTIINKCKKKQFIQKLPLLAIFILLLLLVLTFRSRHCAPCESYDRAWFHVTFLSETIFDLKAKCERKLFEPFETQFSFSSVFD